MLEEGDLNSSSSSSSSSTTTSRSKPDHSLKDMQPLFGIDEYNSSDND